MSVKNRWFHPMKLLVIFLVINIFATKINGLNPRQLQENPGPGAPDVKCTTCCTTCTQSPPPPPPPSPPPPPKKPKSPYCPPPPAPPSPSFIYISGPPGNVYPVDPYFSGAGRVFTVGLPLLVGCGLLGLLAFW